MTVRVLGIPAPQGSKRHVGHGVMIESSKAVKPWRDAVAWAVRSNGTDEQFLDGPVRVRITFILPRPRSVKRGWPWVRPDLDKLVRSTLDGITASGVWTDDAQAVELTARKEYAGAGCAPGALITIQALDGEITP